MTTSMTDGLTCPLWLSIIWWAAKECCLQCDDNIQYRRLNVPTLAQYKLTDGLTCPRWLSISWWAAKEYCLQCDDNIQDRRLNVPTLAQYKLVGC
ncbi:hypothetical protein EVAR_18383_1 [Eumeta japonica]|uniref:Uncharacterized protein n=1 Tax=Eumeta variegata TaxID=151549 RepID=A0A4C1UTT1_EUMVA|nr:hypothetical protein EVAR_18383_1 [Eumeta japonica]